MSQLSQILPFGTSKSRPKKSLLHSAPSSYKPALRKGLLVPQPDSFVRTSSNREEEKVDRTAALHSCDYTARDSGSSSDHGGYLSKTSDTIDEERHRARSAANRTLPKIFGTINERHRARSAAYRTLPKTSGTIDERPRARSVAKHTSSELSTMLGKPRVVRSVADHAPSESSSLSNESSRVPTVVKRKPLKVPTTGSVSRLTRGADARDKLAAEHSPLATALKQMLRSSPAVQSDNSATTALSQALAAAFHTAVQHSVPHDRPHSDRGLPRRTSGSAPDGHDSESAFLDVPTTSEVNDADTADHGDKSTHIQDVRAVIRKAKPPCEGRQMLSSIKS